MSKFYGVIDGSAKTQATRCGTARSGLVTHAASWAGAIMVAIWEDSGGVEQFSVEMTPWKGSGDHVHLCSGVMGDRESVQFSNER